MFNSLTSVVRFIQAKPKCDVTLIESAIGAEDGYRVLVNNVPIAFLDNYAAEQLYGLVHVQVMR